MRAWRALLAAAIASLASGACAQEKVGTVQGPPLLAAPVESDPRPTLDFVDVGAAPPRSEKITLRACEEVLVASVSGGVSVLGEELAQGDVLVAMGSGSLEVASAQPKARVAIARVVPKGPCGSSGPIAKHVAKAAAAKELTWAGGQMHANLDVETSVSPNAYMGRLRGTGKVAEHNHPDSWELLCAIDAAGTFTLGGEEKRLTSGQCVAVPPGVKHQWTPDPGSTLSAVQVYVPPGPEQRFRALAAPPDGGT